jgi:hypothetical protein
VCVRESANGSEMGQCVGLLAIEKGEKEEGVAARENEC